MKTAAVILFSLICSLLSADALISQYFDTYPGLPTGWTLSPTVTNWNTVGTNNAGGTAGELRFQYTPMIDGTFRCISPAFDTRKVHDMTLSFRHMLDDYVTSTNYTIGVQIATNTAGPWTTLWSVTGSSDIAATAVSVPVSFELGKSQTTYIAFYFAGNSDDLNYWYIDNVLLLYNDTLGIGNWSAGIYQPVG
ncbi:MAG: choice-of-anchor J domain-containing protein, partial [Candidatus Cloacimonadaceae bacterium]